MRKLAVTFLGVAIFSTLFACTSAEKKDEASQNPAVPTYADMIRKHTQFFRKYDGFYEAFRGHATLLSPEVRSTQIQQKAAYLDWDSKKIQMERDKNNQEVASQTTVFLQFYAPVQEYDDLDKINSIWHVYLDVDGRKFEAKIKKAKGKLTDFHALYPEFDNFSTPYNLTFSVSTSDVIRHKTKLILASSLGDGEFTFDPAD
jgi:hypothetical protein